MTIEEIKNDPPEACALIQTLKEIILENIESFDGMNCPCAWCEHWCTAGNEHCAAPTLADQRAAGCEWMPKTELNVGAEEDYLEAE